MHQESIRKNNGVSRRLRQEQVRRQRRYHRELHRVTPAHAHAMRFRREHDGEHLIAACHADDGKDDDGALDEVGADPV